MFPFLEKAGKHEDVPIHLKLHNHFINKGQVVQSIFSLTSWLRGQLIKSFMTLLPYTLIFFVEKMRVAFAMQKLLTFFQ